ncbi:RNA 2',3'-cyclic phosphodiesterase [Dyella jejuensis]|uniref:RNA 2',3'-cyclic phosphodiesterase n=2 Tax=Dyella jejuensis TaxID=1432009 RepID=A0ABW8JI84_9GAMM
MHTERSDAQIELFGQPPAHAETHRLFFALMPDVALRHEINHAAALVQLQYPELRARWVKPERFHVTLNFLGDYAAPPEEAAEKAKAAAGRLQANAFDWTLDYVASFRGREPPCVLRSTAQPEPLLTLWRTMDKELTQAGVRRPIERQLTPHVTLAYGRHELPGPTPVAPINWHVDRFALIHNVVGKGNYQVLGSWLLGRSGARDE